MTKVSTFFGENRYLSNFYPSQIVWDNIVFPSVEHAYQAAKSLNRDTRIAVSRLGRPGVVKGVGKIDKSTRKGPEFELAGRTYQIELRPDWETMNLQLMYDLNKMKYTFHADLKAKLLATDEATLEEGNTWHDTFWGICPPDSGIGTNHLGVILMNLREELKNG